MERAELEPIVTLLIDSWRGDVLHDPARWNACRRLDELLRSILSADTIRHARRAPKKYRPEIIAALGQLIQHDPAAERLVRMLLGAPPVTPQAAAMPLPSISIQGSNNQISVGPHLGSVTQIMNPPAGGSRPPQSTDTTAHDVSHPPLFKLQLLQGRDGHIDVRVIQAPAWGQPRATIRPPYTDEELDAVLTAIDDMMTGGRSLTRQQREILRRQSLLNSQQPNSRFLDRIGRQLYDRLFVDDMRVAFQSAISLAHRHGQPLRLWLCMDEDSVLLARYPWELLHDGRRPLLASNAVELRRYITYPEAPLPFHLDLPLSLLYVAPRPMNLTPLSHTTGHSRVPEGLRALERSGALRVTELPSPTYNDAASCMATRSLPGRGQRSYKRVYLRLLPRNRRSRTSRRTFLPEPSISRSCGKTRSPRRSTTAGSDSS